MGGGFKPLPPQTLVVLPLTVIVQGFVAPGAMFVLQNPSCFWFMNSDAEGGEVTGEVGVQWPGGSGAQPQLGVNFLNFIFCV